MAWGDDQRVQWPETLYSFRPNTLVNELIVAKWAGGREPSMTYEISNMGKGRCNCLGSIRKPYCKHREMVDNVERICVASGFKIWGCYYDPDKDILYCPADGEGVPTDMSWMDQFIQKAAVAVAA